MKYTEITSLMLNDIQIRNILINIYEGKNVKELPSLYCAMYKKNYYRSGEQVYDNGINIQQFKTGWWELA